MDIKNYFFLLVIFLIFALLIILLFQSIFNPKLKKPIQRNWPFLILLIISVGILMAVPLILLAKETIIQKDSFQIHLKITETPITPTPTILPPPLPIKILTFNWLKYFRRFFFGWLR